MVDQEVQFRPIDEHRVHSRRLLQHAEEQLENGDRLQASEKAWGAVAHRFKAIAEQRGWRYRTHRQIYDVAANLATETCRPSIESKLAIATQLHQNFYDDQMPESTIRASIREVKELLKALDEVGIGRAARRQPAASP